MKTSNLLTTKEAAALLGVHPKQIYRLLKRGLPALRVGDEWRFEREPVLEWAGARGRAATGGAPAQGAPMPASSTAPITGVPPLLAANGDCAIDVVLGALHEQGGPLLGFVLDDHAGGAALLASGAVLVAGQHGEAASPPGAKWARLHLVTREVGLCSRSRSRQRLESALVGRRLASRPSTAGIRGRLDGVLERAGTSLQRAYAKAVELDSHRSVALAVSSGRADIGIATHAWASAAGLVFQPFATEVYELAVNAERLGDARVIALLELLQSGRLRKRLRDGFGYGVGKTGELRIG